MYNHSLIEKKWREYWEKNKTNQFIFNSKKKKFYSLPQFPYPSGSSLHTGHAFTFTLTDIFSRYKLAKGYNVFQPFGWDAFGLPSEQFAIKNNVSPIGFTQKNIDIFREQLKTLGFYYDYDYEVDTTDPKYYRNTQWIFGKLVEEGLAELKDIEVNWCEELTTVLANDETIIKDGKMVSERGEYPVIRKPMKQWVINITKYAEELTNGFDKVDWDPSYIATQKKWIGISNGANIKFKTTAKIDVEVYTTRPDTVFGISFIAIAPENKLVHKLTTKENLKAIKKYQLETEEKSELERKEDKTKTGVFTGSYAINPFNNKKIPIYIADYVLNNYATGSIMAVPAHDQRDYEFAKLYKLPIVKVIKNDVDDQAYTKDGEYINSGFLNGIKNKNDAIKKAIEFIQKNKIGKKATTTKMHDWTFSRQRYWGEPFPIVYDSKNKPIIVDSKNLPVILPELDEYKPDKTGLSPLSRAPKDWLNVIINKKKYTREIQTMPGSAGSSWYFLAYALKNPDGSYVDIESKEGKKRISQLLPVDFYISGKEHTTGHLLYARFWHKFLYKIGIVKDPEPFAKLVDHGLILGPDGRKMGKRYGNVVTPDEITASHGADAMRTYVAFIGPMNGTFPWNPSSLDGIRKWLDRVYNLFDNKNIIISKKISDISEELNIAYNKFVKNATNNLEELKQNIVVSDMMVYINECYKNKVLYFDHIKGFITILSCFAPFIAEEINLTFLNSKDSITKSLWPTFDDKLTKDTSINLPVQVDGKLRSTLPIKTDCNEKDVIKLALNDEKISKYLVNGYSKVIYVKNKILSFISKK